MTELDRSIGLFDSEYASLEDENISHTLTSIFLKASSIRNLKIYCPNRRLLRIIQKGLLEDILVDELWYYHEYVDYFMR